ncbi:hypothetical protein EVAR_78276_1 [Eumeta japonica]|uniref:Uncharacterized protein n=1 Tax=Eumeta variegata TaxID=151549 RepID=A0A4C1T302_EUMVA|nr:hypothetical protein EVAR_78276_1 [Eumeta japonica]
MRPGKKEEHPPSVVDPNGTPDSTRAGVIFALAIPAAPAAVPGERSRGTNGVREASGGDPGITILARARRAPACGSIMVTRVKSWRGAGTPLSRRTNMSPNTDIPFAVGVAYFETSPPLHRPRSGTSGAARPAARGEGAA